MTNNQRWGLADKVGKALKIPKHVAFPGISILEDAGILHDVIAGNQEAIVKAYTFSWYGFNGEPIDESPKQKKLRNMAGDVKLMLWAIDKIGDIDLAKKAFDKALKALED